MSSSSIAQRIRVPLGFAYGLLFLYLARPQPSLFSAGIVVAAFGLALRVWASGYLNKGRELARSGPYSWTRNPLYLGSFVMGLGFAIASSNMWLTILFLVLFAAVYLPVMKREEDELVRAFGPEYASYRDSVALFLPIPSSSREQPKPAYSELPGNFQWKKVISNREYNAVIGFAVVTAVIGAKMVLWR